MTWPEAKTALVKGMGGLFIAWMGWTLQQSFHASMALREAVADLKAVVWELRASSQSTKEQVSTLSTRTDAQFREMAQRIQRLEAEDR